MAPSIAMDDTRDGRRGRRDRLVAEGASGVFFVCGANGLLAAHVCGQIGAGHVFGFDVAEFDVLTTHVDPHVNMARRRLVGGVL